MEFEKVQNIISSALDIDRDEITADTRFDDMGADSLDIMEIIMALEAEFDIEISDDAVDNIVTVGDVVEQIKNTIN